MSTLKTVILSLIVCALIVFAGWAQRSWGDPIADEWFGSGNFVWVAGCEEKGRLWEWMYLTMDDPIPPSCVILPAPLRCKPLEWEKLNITHIQGEKIKQDAGEPYMVRIQNLTSSHQLYVIFFVPKGDSI